MVLNKNVIFFELLVPLTPLRIVLSFSALSKNLYLVREMKPQCYPDVSCYFRCAVTAELVGNPGEYERGFYVKEIVQSELTPESEFSCLILQFSLKTQLCYNVMLIVSLRNLISVFSNYLHVVMETKQNKASCSVGKKLL